MEYTTYIGLDVHARQVSIGVAQSGREAGEYKGVVAATGAAVLRALKKYKPEETLVVYEAGPTGYKLYRHLKKHGYTCEVIAPCLVPKKSAERVKTDRRDAVSLAQLSRSGELTSVWVPDEEDEAFRDLVRCRHDSKGAEKRAKQQLNSFLLRYGLSYGEKKWTKKHWAWIRSHKFDHETQVEALCCYMTMVQECEARVESLDARLAEYLKTWKRKETCEKLMSLRGIDRTSALIIVTEIGDLKRFKSAPEFMSFVGLVPSEHSSGERQRRSSITKTGNKIVRRTLVESAWSYRLTPSKSPVWKRRNEKVTQEVRDISWEAQKRLNYKYRKLRARGMLAQKVITAVARELSGFVWSVANA